MANRFNSRTRFNWGFHDAQHDMEQGWSNRLENEMLNGIRRPLPSGEEGEPYRLGYEYGIREFKETGKRNPSSQPAWDSLDFEVLERFSKLDEQ